MNNQGPCDLQGPEATALTRGEEVNSVPPYALLLIVAAVLAAIFLALFKALPQGPRAVLAVAAVLTAAAGLIGAISATAASF